MQDDQTRQYIIGGIRFKVKFLCPLFSFDHLGGSVLFQNSSEPIIDDWSINVDDKYNCPENELTDVFVGSDEFGLEMPYKWSVVKYMSHFGIKVEFSEHDLFKEAFALINDEKKEINLHLKLKKTQKICSFDPFFHPLGILMIKYIVQLHKGFVIHASAIEYNNKGYLFTAVSGTGKSTMANIWKQCGANIINDDRLMVMPKDDGYVLYNSPMPYYQDRPKCVKLHKAFVIKQSPENYLKELSPLKGTLGLLSNCMQFQYNQSFIQQRLNALEWIASNCKVYECGFKPDDEIVSLILNELE